MMYFFDCSPPDVKLIRRPASRAILVNVTGKGLLEGAERPAGVASRVAGPCAAAKNPSRAMKTNNPRITTILLNLPHCVIDYANDIDSLLEAVIRSSHSSPE